MGFKHRRHEEHENHERWLVSYADFITLLFAFFVVMYATSTVNEEKQKNFEESVKKSFNISAFFGSGGNGSGGTINDYLNQLGNPIEAFPRGNSAAEALDYVERKIDQTIPKEERDKYISSMRHDSIGVRISLASSSFFNTGSVKLRTQSLDSLNKVAEILKQTDKKVIIEGHTDDAPVAEGSPFESNWELASLRATTVVRYLERVHGISPKRMAAISFADQKPIVPNVSEDNRNKNRRIEILIVMDEKN